jgi:hypothetical protein
MQGGKEGEVSSGFIQWSCTVRTDSWSAWLRTRDVRKTWKVLHRRRIWSMGWIARSWRCPTHFSQAQELVVQEGERNVRLRGIAIVFYLKLRLASKLGRQTPVETALVNVITVVGMMEWSLNVDLKEGGSVLPIAKVLRSLEAINIL